MKHFYALHWLSFSSHTINTIWQQAGRERGAGSREGRGSRKGAGREHGAGREQGESTLTCEQAYEFYALHWLSFSSCAINTIWEQAGREMGAGSREGRGSRKGAGMEQTDL